MKAIPIGERFGAFLIFGVSLCGVMIGHEVWAQGFYEGQTVRVVVFGTAGGANDLWARLVGRYMPKHIPGTPTFIVQNMPGPCRDSRTMSSFSSTRFPQGKKRLELRLDDSGG